MLRLFSLIFICLFTRNIGYSEKPSPFKIDPQKLERAFQTLNDYERLVQHDSLCNKTVLKEISMQDVCADLRRMLSHPNATILNDNGYYCGIAVVLNWLLNNKPDGYIRAVLELASKGETKFENSSFIIKVPRALKKRVLYSEKTKIKGIIVRKSIDSTSISDFILGVSLVYSEKAIQRIGLLCSWATYNKHSIASFIFGNTMPWEINDFFEKIGVSIEEQGYYLGDDEDIDQLKKIERAVKAGEMPVVFENHLLTATKEKNLIYRFTGVHFITIHDFEIDEKNNLVHFSYWDYGSVQNKRYVCKSPPLETAKNLRQAMRMAKRMKNHPDPEDKELTVQEFLKAMKGYWVPSGN